ncbi:hypothetical protein F0225_14745 [Vibrio pectenicida]|uniref:Integrase n=1 Tax=Vibrio pectenicida TaxID=62763 RepID=A0A7Y4EEC3_9VIBR|nr:hypothetical protein [Vibrio pectenicida]NOH72590.1 hypothetical protein [Vibrio pectenicida]
MNALNRFITNQYAYIAEKKKQPLLAFNTPSGKQATWEDIAITFTNNKSIPINLLFNNENQPNANINSTFSDKDKLDADTQNLLFAFALDVLKENISISNKKSKVTTAKKFLIALDENVASCSMNEIQKTIDEMGYIQPLNAFFKWLNVHKLLPASISPNLTRKVNNTRSQSGDDAIKAESNKLPDEKALLALGAIFYDVIPPYHDIDKAENTDSWTALKHSTTNQLDSYVCTMSALAMSSPNRAAVEQVLLTKQRVKNHDEVVNNHANTTYYLNWRGSKGYKDYQNHINAEMAESLNRSLHYTTIVTEPARVLARFYQNPRLCLKKVLGDFKPNLKNLDTLAPNYNEPTNLIHLGFLLGFYDDSDGYARVTCDTKGAINVTKRRDNPKFIKHFSKLSPLDKLEIKKRCHYASLLVGATMNEKRQLRKYFNNQTEITVAEFQNHHIKINQQAISGYNRAKTKRVNYDRALFAYTEKQLSTQRASHFLLLPIESLGALFDKNLKKRKKDHITIFERHGFSENFSITPHQFRHWQNNYLANKGLPHLLITMLSGRKNPEQTLTYIHTTDAQNASVISDILYEKETKKEVQYNVSKRLQSKAQYDDATNNLSPTFVSEVGFCTQDLTLTPCTYMTEFETQCTLCASSCHIAHDDDAIEFLKKDLIIQTHNLKQVQEAINFVTSDGMQQWYQTHYRNTCMLKSLIEVLSDKSIKEGSIVRFLARSNVMRITNLDTKTVTEQKLSLPNEKEALQAAIEAASLPVDNSAKMNFLGFLGSI